jgi:hypothetical protein
MAIINGHLSSKSFRLWNTRCFQRFAKYLLRPFSLVLCQSPEVIDPVYIYMYDSLYNDKWPYYKPIQDVTRFRTLGANSASFVGDLKMGIYLSIYLWIYRSINTFGYTWDIYPMTSTKIIMIIHPYLCISMSSLRKTKCWSNGIERPETSDFESTVCVGGREHAWRGRRHVSISACVPLEDIWWSWW